MNTIHKICGGIPRLINLVCERSLINAYSSNTAVVNKRIVLLSAHEALGDDYEVTPWWQSRMFKVALAFFAISFFSVGAYFFGIHQNKNIGLKPVVANNNAEQVVDDLQKPELIESSPSVSDNVVEAIKTDNVDSKILNTAVNKVVPAEPMNNSEPQKTSAPIIEKETKLNDEKPLVEVKSKQQAVPAKDIELTQVEGVSEELLEQFKKALNNESNTNANNEYTDTFEYSGKTQEIESIDKMPLWIQDGIPQLQFEQHIYSSDGQGWVKVNGRDRYEGDTIARELILVEILPQKVVLNFRGEKFTMSALSSW
jgi:hypothetical protein